MTDNILEAFAGGLMLIISLSVVAVVLGVDATLVSGVLTDAVTLFTFATVLLGFVAVVSSLTRAHG